MTQKKSKRKPLKFELGFECILLVIVQMNLPAGYSLESKKALEVFQRWMNRPDNRDTTAFVEMMTELKGLIQG